MYAYQIKNGISNVECMDVGGNLINWKQNNKIKLKNCI